MNLWTRRDMCVMAGGALPLLVYGQNAANNSEQMSWSSVMTLVFDWMEKPFVQTAEAMPEAKFFWTPAPSLGAFQDVRNFSEQIVHVSQVNAALAGAMLGKDISKDPALTAPSEKGATRAAVLQYLYSSLALARQACLSINDSNARLPLKHPLMDLTTTRVDLATVIIAHSFNHYGQMVEYLRMNNVVPPASRSSQ